MSVQSEGKRRKKKIKIMVRTRPFLCIEKENKYEKRSC
jgi:hypothetical protein